MTGTQNRDLTQDDYYTQNEMESLIATARLRAKIGYSRYSFRNHTTYALLALLFKTGLRVSEALSITTAQIKKGLAHGEFKIIGKGGMNTSDKSKKKKYTRSVRMSSDLSEVLQHYLKNRIEKFGSSCDRLFITTTGKTLLRTDIYKRIQNICKCSDVEFKGVHATRHSVGMLTYQHKRCMKTTASILGHRDIRTTDIYVKANSSEVLEALESLPSVK